jgi:RNA polymerase-binding transcription factor
MEHDVNDDRARLLLSAERSRVETLLDAVKDDGLSDRSAASQQGDMSDSSEVLVSEGTDDAVAQALALRLAAIERAEQRLAAGTYGRSILSGDVIPDERLEADPSAELTVDEAEKT